jgi:hypothetical protein
LLSAGVTVSGSLLSCTRCSSQHSWSSKFDMAGIFTLHAVVFTATVPSVDYRSANNWPHSWSSKSVKFAELKLNAKQFQFAWHCCLYKVQHAINMLLYNDTCIHYLLQTQRMLPTIDIVLFCLVCRWLFKAQPEDWQMWHRLCLLLHDSVHPTVDTSYLSLKKVRHSWWFHKQGTRVGWGVLLLQRTSNKGGYPSQIAIKT